MKIFSSYCDDSELQRKFDLGIFSSGYEPRSTHIFSKNVKCDMNIVLGFKSFQDNVHRIKNDVFFKKKQLYNKIS
ncbi:hypothetical protein BV902_13105 [Sphingobacterium sp. B29]|nr:hypothetical protein BV902_13105 [Sphingobacterium sp. B29]